MNLRVSLTSLHTAVPAQADLARRARFNPRAGILDEVIAGLLWMSLDLPADVSRLELESFAHHLVIQIQAGAAESEIEQEIAALQSGQLCRPANPEMIQGLVLRAIGAVRA